MGVLPAISPAAGAGTANYRCAEPLQSSIEALGGPAGTAGHVTEQNERDSRILAQDESR